ncbi:uncharacterized protein LOC132835256 isoform X1 [Hemiscyllium ocellatum]|uniref:uncharacterized protein LOC132835256 isoform X1 n=1 Tax=Hemiscyllium ocellatum TaxID=170820 RepID=UPI0029662718|nr:uncharacterized protein LOC132835256 isoform X1 [Hemiscyllium ocellatum]
MNMKLSSVTGIILLLLLIQAGGPVHGGVHQSPDLLKAEEGDDVALHCHFDPSNHPSQLVALQWNLPEGEVYAIVPGNAKGGKTSKRLVLEVDLQARSSLLRISGAITNDSGLYVCLVELLEPLPIIQMKGSGTQLHVIPGNRTNQVRKEPKHIEDFSSNGTNPGTNVSKMILGFTVNVISRPMMELSCFISLLCLVTLALVAGLGDSVWMRWKFSQRSQTYNIRRHKGNLRVARRGVSSVSVM